jgi:cytoskeletal protein CcmA (bactofilin family)
MAWKLWESLNSREQQPAPLPGDDMVGYFEPGVVLEGKMKVATGMIRLNTHFRGEIQSAGTIVVAEQGEVEASIQAKAISISGKIKGNVKAEDRLEIKEKGVVLGDIYTRVLIVEAGGYFDGQCQMPTPGVEKPVDKVAEAEKSQQL